MGDPQPLADTLRKCEKPIPPEVREFLAEALLSGPKKPHGRRLFDRSALNYMYKVAAVLEGMKKARVPRSTITRREGEAIAAVVKTTGSKPDTIKKKIDLYRREVRGSFFIELMAAGFEQPATVRRHVSGRDVRPKATNKNLALIPNSVFALGGVIPDERK